MAQSYLVVAVVAGLALGFAFGGRLRHLSGHTFRWWLLLPLGVILQALVEVDGVPAPHAFLLLSYAYLLLFVVANLGHRGMGIVLVGIGFNVVVIALNHGMPVRASAIRAANPDARGRPIAIHEVKHHLERPDSTLMPLADVVPVRPLNEVLSFGDLVLAVGVADVLVHLLRPAPGRHRAGRVAPDVRAVSVEA